jgi:pimeloyl-ACP methyl ester carboxylesterase
VTTFGLVHGAWHGAWCWDGVVDELARRGHRGVAVDLPCEDPDAGIDEYAATVVDRLRGVDGDVVLVGHSLGGVTIPVVAERRPVAGLVFLCALLPTPGEPFAADADTFCPDFPRGRGTQETEAAIEFFFHDLPRAEAEAAARQLRRQRAAPFERPNPLRSWPPGGPSRYVLCREDRVVNPDWSRRVAVERLGVTPIELDGGHSPMLSGPVELVDLLLLDSKRTQTAAVDLPEMRLG